MKSKKYQLTPTDPHDVLRHAQALYTKLDAECDQQATVVGRRLTAADNIRHRRRQVLSITDRQLLLVYIHLAMVDMSSPNLISPELRTIFVVASSLVYS